MAKVNSPTANLFAILADPHATDSLRDDNQSPKAKVASNKATTEITPKERAAAKAEENAAKAARRQAERERKALEAEQKKAFEAIPDEGFSKQRTQRIKEQHTAKRAAESAPPAPKEPKAEGTKTEKKAGNKGPNPNKTANPNKGQGKGQGNQNAQTQAAKNWKNFPKDAVAPAAGDQPGPVKEQQQQPPKPKNNNNNSGKGPKREFDKHSAGKTGRQPVAKKDGSGKRNWGKDVPAAATTTDASSALNAITEDEWDAPGAVVVEEKPAQTAEATEGGEAAAVDGEAQEEEDEKDANQQTLDEFLAQRDEKKKELAALLGGTRDKPRELTDEEKKSLAKFTLVENVREKDPKEVKLASSASAAAKPSANTTARKGEKAVAINDILNVRVAAPPRENNTRGRGGRGGGRGNRGDHAENTDKPKQQKPKDSAPRGGSNNAANRGRGQGRRVKINQHSQEQFPSLGKA